MGKTRMTLAIVGMAVFGVSISGTVITPAPAVPPVAVAPEYRTVVQHTYQSDPITFAAVGDSMTAWNDRITGAPRGDLTWVNWVKSDGLEFVGGWAWGGMNTREMLAAVQAGVPELAQADVMVLMAGTNDVGPSYGGGMQMAESMANLDAIIAGSGARKVIVSAIAPSNVNPIDGLTYNAILAQHAAEMGWTLVDPWTTVRNHDGTYLEGSNVDGRHPNAATQSVVGSYMASAIISASG